MAYMLTAIMSGGVAAILAMYQGAGFGTIFWNYVLFGHLGMATLALASIASSRWDRNAND